MGPSRKLVASKLQRNLSFKFDNLGNCQSKAHQVQCWRPPCAKKPSLSLSLARSSMFRTYIFNSCKSILFQRRMCAILPPTRILSPLDMGQNRFLNGAIKNYHHYLLLSFSIFNVSGTIPVAMHQSNMKKCINFPAAIIITVMSTFSMNSSM